MRNERGWLISYEASDEQLLASGLVSPHTLAVSKLPYLRPSGAAGEFEPQGMDGAYVNRIDEAKDRVALAALAINNPDVKMLWYPPHLPAEQAFIGLVRHD